MGELDGLVVGLAVAAVVLSSAVVSVVSFTASAVGKLDGLIVGVAVGDFVFVVFLGLTVGGDIAVVGGEVAATGWERTTYSLSSSRAQQSSRQAVRTHRILSR